MQTDERSGQPRHQGQKHAFIPGVLTAVLLQSSFRQKLKRPRPSTTSFVDAIDSRSSVRLCCLFCPAKRIDEGAQFATVGVTRIRQIGLLSTPRDQRAAYQGRTDCDQHDP
jgi:hypothetical protein